MRKTFRNPLIALLAALGVIFATSASAQDAEQVSAEDINKFAEAYMAVQTINQEYSTMLQQVEDPERATELQQEAQTKMQQAVTDSGLSISDYQGIAQQANQSEAVREDIQNAVAALAEAPQPQ
jgi:Skp family chaperone for outer membrane proteins